MWENSALSIAADVGLSLPEAFYVVEEIETRRQEAALLAAGQAQDDEQQQQQQQQDWHAQDEDEDHNKDEPASPKPTQVRLSGTGAKLAKRRWFETARMTRHDPLLIQIEMTKCEHRRMEMEDEEWLLRQIE